MVLSYTQLCQSSKARQLLVSLGVRIDPADWERAKQMWAVSANHLGDDASVKALCSIYVGIPQSAADDDTVIRLEG